MKLNPVFGKGTGKVGGLVFANVAGEQVVREYNSSVSNPNTEAQVGQRARFKLASQLATALSNTIAIPKKGLVSARNQFVKKNFAAINEQDGEASVGFEHLQLTDSNIAIPALLAGIENGTLTLSLTGDASQIADRVVYNVYKIDDNNQLVFVTSGICETAGTGGTFPTTLNVSVDNGVAYAYGIKDKNAAATAKYENYQVSSGEKIASLVANRSMSASDYSFTKTVGTAFAE